MKRVFIGIVLLLVGCGRNYPVTEPENVINSIHANSTWGSVGRETVFSFNQGSYSKSVNGTMVESGTYTMRHILDEVFGLYLLPTSGVATANRFVWQAPGFTLGGLGQRFDPKP